MKSNLLRSISIAATATMLSVANPSTAQSQDTTLRIATTTKLVILDPIWTTAVVTRSHGYMVYDTLFAPDEKGRIQLQMLDSHDVSGDGLTHTMRLRKGLSWHDGTPVTAEDCVSSIRRWWSRDGLGGTLRDMTTELAAADEQTIRLVTSKPTGLVKAALGKASSNVPFMMPARVAATNPSQQISDFTGSGPYVFDKDAWKPGYSTTYTRFDKYIPRAEPASGLAGGKVAKLDKIILQTMPNGLTALTALQQGEVDFMANVPVDLHRLVEPSGPVRLEVHNPGGAQYVLVPNHRNPPFNNPTMRKALLHALNQEDVLKANIGNPAYYRTCLSFLPCGDLPEAPSLGGTLSSNYAESKRLLREAGYDGSPVVLMAPSDFSILKNVAPVVRHHLERGGFNIEMQPMDWQSLLARRGKKDLSKDGGWDLFPTSIPATDAVDALFIDGRCEQGLPGWVCDAELLRLKMEYLNTPPEQRARAAVGLQDRAGEIIPFVPLGQWRGVDGVRQNVKGFLEAPVTVFWNVEKDQDQKAR